MVENGLWRLSATEQTRRIRDGEASAVDVMESVLNRIESVNPILHAYCTLDSERARQQAASVDAALGQGEPVGSLAGVPLSIKDLIDTAGLRTTYGSVAYRDRVPSVNDVVVQRLLDASGVVVGKTNTSEFGYIAACHNKLFPTTRNPWNPQLNPGGSSGGAAAAVASGMGAIAIGSDGGGSVRLPAALCGLVGFKGSFGVIPSFPGCRDPRLPGASSWESLEVLGVLARTVADVALVMDAAAGPEPRDRHSLPPLPFDWATAARGGIEGARIAWTVDFGGLVTVDPEVQRVFREAVGSFLDMGCTLVEAAPEVPELDDTFAALIARDSDLRGMRHLIETTGAQSMLPAMVGLIQREWSATEFTDAAMMQQRVTNEMSAFMADYDFLLTPTVPSLAFDLDVAAPTQIAGKKVSSTHFLSFVRIFNMTRQPAISVPAGWSDEGLPVGLQIVGRPLADGQVLAAAAAYEQARPWGDRWPDMEAYSSTA